MSVVTHRCPQFRVIIARGTHVSRHLQIHQHILGFLLIPIESYINSIIEETEVKSQIDLFLFLPFHIQIRNILRTVTGSKRGIHLLHIHTPHIRINTGITSLPPTSTEFTIANPFNILHELLISKAPRQSERVKSCPTIVWAEV